MLRLLLICLLLVNIFITLIYKPPQEVFVLVFPRAPYETLAEDDAVSLANSIPSASEGKWIQGLTLVERKRTPSQVAPAPITSLQLEQWEHALFHLINSRRQGTPSHVGSVCDGCRSSQKTQLAHDAPH